VIRPALEVHARPGVAQAAGVSDDHPRTVYLFWIQQ
jgi:hypothetical protein